MKRVFTLLLALAMLFALAACGGDTNSANTNDPNTSDDGTGTAAPKTLIIGTTNDVTIPFDNTNSTNINGFGLCYDRLTYIDPYTGERVSNILDDWYYEDDLHLVLKVKEGVTFTDGTPLKGEDIVYSFADEVKRGGNNAGNLANFDWANTVVSDDGLTVTIPTFKEYAPGIVSLSSWIENRAFDEAHPSDDEIWWDTVQGTGPYYCVEQVDGAYSTYALRDNYWDSEEYEFDTITFKYYSDVNALFIDYENGNIDVALNIGSYNYNTILNGGESDTVAKLLGDGNPLNLCVDYTKVEAWNNPLVRQAVAHALNYEALGIAGFDGMYKLNHSFMPETVSYHEDVGEYEYDPELSRQLLAEAGYPNGFSFTLVTYEIFNDLAIALQDQLAQIGITVTLDVGQMMPQLKRLLAGEGDACIMQTNTDNCGEPSLTYQKFVAVTDNIKAAAVYDEDWNALLESSFTMDQEAREKIIREIQHNYHDNVWQVALLERCEAWCYNSNILPEDFEAYIGGTPTFRVTK